eukprot:Sspe_Gene.83567::Locus_54814_Transcript_1_1_Confidence_1.000_Length_453::g.83567::m.83567
MRALWCLLVVGLVVPALGCCCQSEDTSLAAECCELTDMEKCMASSRCFWGCQKPDGTPCEEFHRMGDLCRRYECPERKGMRCVFQGEKCLCPPPQCHEFSKEKCQGALCPDTGLPCAWNPDRETCGCPSCSAFNG